MVFSSTVGPQLLPLSGGTLTGALTLNADPTSALQAATKNYVDTHVSAGNLVQAVYSSTNSSLTAALGSFSTTGISATITPTNASHHILIMGFLNFAILASGVTDAQMFLQLYKAGSTLADFATEGVCPFNMSNLYIRSTPMYYDLAGTTSATTYEFFFENFSAGSTQAIINNGAQLSGMILIELAL